MTSQLHTSIYRGYHPLTRHTTVRIPLTHRQLVQQYIAFQCGTATSEARATFKFYFKDMSLGQFVDANGVELVAADE